VWATCDQQLIADYVRCHIPRQVITNPNHVTTAATLRGEFQRQKAKEATAPNSRLVLVENRDLATYDEPYTLRAVA